MYVSNWISRSGASLSPGARDSVAVSLQRGVMGALWENTHRVTEPQYSCNYTSWLYTLTVLHCCPFLLPSFIWQYDGYTQSSRYKGGNMWKFSCDRNCNMAGIVFSALWLSNTVQNSLTVFSAITVLLCTVIWERFDLFTVLQNTINLKDNKSENTYF